MGIFGSKVVDSVGNAVEKVGEAGDKLFTSNEEVRTIGAKMHEVDMQSDNWLSKSIRPLAFLLCILAFIGMIVASGFGVVFSTELFELVGKILAIMIGMYYSSRGVEKIFNDYSKTRRKRGA